MKISYNWLKDYLDFDIQPDELSEILTNIGLEVEGMETFEEVKGGLRGLVIGQVVTCKKHPNADKLSKTTIDIGTGNDLNVICGAPNVAAGQKVVVATVGTTLYMGEKSFEIKKTKIRGEESEGMICAEDEIGLGTSHDGIMVLPDAAKIGTPAADYFQIITDTVFEIGLTPNRIDAGSHYGVARDLAVYFSLEKETKAKHPDISVFKQHNHDLDIPVTIKNPEACKRYTGLTVTNLKIAPSPKWMQNRLKAIGLNPINNVVDITNFVLHELGQPLHAFDADKLQGKEIVVQKLPAGTKFKTLDEVERTLTGDDLMICDSKHPACMGGIFGGIDSGVTESTKNIFLESAYFDPGTIRKSAKYHQLSTDSSFRFERGVDPNMTTFALKRAAQLMVEIAGGVISSDIKDVYPEPIQPFNVKVKWAHIDRLIGKKLDHDLVKKIITAFEMEIKSESDTEMQLIIPPYRVDVTREADVIEDILRVYGYNNVEFSEKLHTSISYKQKPDNESMVEKASEYLASEGFSEMMANSLTKSEYYKELKSYPANDLVEIMNPLSSDLNVMRQTMLFGALQTVAYNINRKNSSLRLFEFGNCYYKKPGKDFKSYSEKKKFTLILTGLHEEQNWKVAEEKVSFFHLKAYIENFLTKGGVDVKELIVSPLDNKDDIYDGGLVYSLNRQTIAEAGIVATKLLRQFDIEQEVYYAEIEWDILLKKIGKPIQFQEMPKFPEVRRDLALLLDDSVTYQQIVDIATKIEKNILRRVSLFDYYKGKNIAEGKKSYGVSFYLQDLKKTLTDKEIDRIMEKISTNLVQELGAELR